MTCGIECIDKWLTKAFYRLGLVVAKHPGYFLMVPVFLTAICITGFQRVKFEIDPEYLFSPEQGPGKTERAIVETYFKMNYSSLFNPTRITRPGRFGRVIVIPKKSDTMLSVEIWKELRILDDIIRNATVTWGPENTVYKYDDICARWIDQCFPNDILNLDYVMNDVVNGSLKLTFPIMFNPVTWDAHTFPVYFGGTEMDEDGLITRVPALQLVYFITADTKAQDERGSVWEEAFLDAVGTAEDTGRFSHISTARFGSRTLDIELENNTRTVVPYFSSAFVLMAVFSVVTCMMTDWVRSKPLLGLMGNVSAAMATIAAFGCAVYVGIPFIGINFVSPFLMCSIGIDDTFVMLAAWRRTPVTMDVPERLARTLSDAAVSITITSVTDIVSFCIGKFSPFPAIQIFCLYSGFAVCFIFVWHLTFFSACMAIAGYAEHNNRHSITCIKVKPVSMSGTSSITSESEDIGIMADMQEVMDKDDSTFIEHISMDPNVSVTSDLGDINTGPARPILQVYPKTKFGIQNRSFSSKLYSNYDWLEYSVRKDLVFCYFCRIFGLGNYNEDTDTFTTKGFQNWRKIREKCNSHSSSKQHLINKTKYTSYLSSKSKGSVVSKLSEGHQKEVNENREYLTKLIEILLYLSRQGIPLRGHFEDKDSLNQGNFKEACHLLKKFDQQFAKKFNCTTNYSSWSIQNQILSICAQMVRDKIILEVQKNGFFALMCDEARSFKGEQMSVCLRYAKDLDIHERFLGFLEVSKGHDADFLATMILNFLQKSKIGDSHVIAQSHDGASVMSGHLGGVQAKIKNKFPTAIYTHCMAHRLNLVVVDMCKNIKDARNLFNILESIYIHFAFPSKNQKLQEVQKELGMKNKTMIHMSDTRWVCRYKNCDAVITNFAAILQILHGEIEENSDRNVSQAIGIYSSITKGSFVVNLFIFNEVLCIVNILSNKLQQKTATLGKAVGIIKAVIDTFEKKRCDGEFSVLWTNIKGFADKHDISLEVPSRSYSKRNRREPNYLADFNVTTTTAAEVENVENSVECYWRNHIYFVILDTVLNNLKTRFSEESMKMASAVDNFFSLDFEESQYFINHYKDILNIEIKSLMAEMIVAQNSLKTLNQQFDIENLKKSVEKHVYPNLYKLLQVALTLPISSATCERSFSALRKIKTWLRVSMGQERLTDLSILYIEKDLTNKIDIKEVIRIFAQTERRIILE